MEGITLYQDFKRTYMRGLIFYKTGKYDEAKVYLTKAIGMADELLKNGNLSKIQRAAVNWMYAALESMVEEMNENNNPEIPEMLENCAA